jgi:hypothetical protein
LSLWLDVYAGVNYTSICRKMVVAKALPNLYLEAGSKVHLHQSTRCQTYGEEASCLQIHVRCNRIIEVWYIQPESPSKPRSLTQQVLRYASAMA